MSVTGWSEWHPLDLQSLTRLVPDSPGIYEIRTDLEFGRLRGSSQIVYVGSAKGSLKQRLRQRVSYPDRYLTMAEKWLRQAGHALELHYATASDGATARRLEMERFKEYEQDHWELPPGNGILPREVWKSIMQ